MDNLAQKELGIKRTRKRKESFKVDHQEIAERVCKFYSDGISERQEQVDLRLQRYAKLRMWREGRNWPWANSFDAGIPDLMSHSLRLQDTLHNAVMTMRPAISASSLSGKEDEAKQEKIDRLIDYQVFVENRGEEFIGEAAESFINDEVLTVYVPWVEEKREVVEVKIYDPIPEDELPLVYFKSIISSEFQKGDIYKENDGWDWRIDLGEEEVKAHFYTNKEEKVELVIERIVSVFDGPRPTVVDWEDIVCPPRCANLQPPGPSNPKGAPWTIMRSFPLVDEIKRLKDTGFYDLLTDEDLDKISNASLVDTDREKERQKDAMQGVQKNENSSQHKSLTRLMCLDRYDVDGDGFEEDVIFWVILETKTLLRAKYLTEMFPADPPRRPFAEASFIRVGGRRDGISLPELLESTHDLMKQFTDQVGDAGTLANAPFGFYRTSSNVKQEVMRMSPGDLYPLSDPRNDVYFPSLPGQSQAFGLNMITMFGAQQDRLAMQGDLQFGRVPRGQASALRTAGAQQNILMQGEARPERILRRFFMCLTEVWTQIHEMNQRFLKPGKKYKVMGFVEDGKDPYNEIKSTREIEGRFQFEFKANVLNSSKQALQGVYTQLMGLYLSPIAIQLGLVGKNEIYRLLKDAGQALGQGPEKGYLIPPSPDADLPGIFFEEAITDIMNHQHPMGRPLEGNMQHLQKLIAFAQTDEFGLLDPASVQIFAAYTTETRQKAIQEMQMMQMAQLAAQMTTNPMTQPGPAPNTDQPMVEKNELMDETLPSARGDG